MQSWMILIIIYGLLCGVSDIFKKQGMKVNHSIEVLAIFITFAFVLVFFDIRNAIYIKPLYLGMICFKSLIILIAWLLSFKAMSKLSVSLYGVINMSRILFTSILGMFILHETFSHSQLIGMLIICLGLILVNLSKGDNKKNSVRYVAILFIGCVFQSISGLLDKIILSDINPIEMQWWYLFFLTVDIWLYILLRKIKLDTKKMKKNYWAFISSLVFVVGDRLMFMANAMPESEISIMSLLKQVSVIVTVLIGGKIFKEKNFGYKFVCSLIIVMGIIIVTLY